MRLRVRYLFKPEFPKNTMKKKSKKNTISKISGIKGWLLTFVIITLLGIILAIDNLAPMLAQILTSSLTQTLLIIMLLLLIILTINSLILIFTKSEYAPIWTIVFLMYDIAVNITYCFVNTSPLISRVQYISLTLAAIILDLAWILYFNYSQRIKNTFL